jgi:hypothetical protein
MNRSRAFLPAAVLASLSLTVAPAFAQHGGGHGRSSSGSRGSSGRAVPRSVAPPRGYSGPSRSYGAPARTYNAPSRGYGYGGAYRGAVQSRGYYGAQSRGYYPASRGRAVVRVAPRIVNRVYIAPYRYYRPYYTFRPRFSIGFGLWVGYPVVYSYPFYYGYPEYYDPYYSPYGYPSPAYGYPAPYGYPPAPYASSAYPQGSYPQSTAPQSGYYDPNASQGTVIARQGTASGSISFEISPSTAEVYIDSTYVGHVSDLGPNTQPLALTPGRHHVEIRAAGYQTLSLDADVTAGQVVPYQGQMQPVR